MNSDGKTRIDDELRQWEEGERHSKGREDDRVDSESPPLSAEGCLSSFMSKVPLGPPPYENEIGSTEEEDAVSN